MEKLVIKNYGPIKNAILDLKSFVILIGPQSSGKSAIAKLISILRNLVYRSDDNAFSEMHESFDIAHLLDNNAYIQYSTSNFVFEFSNLSGHFSFINEIDTYREKIKTLRQMEQNNSGKLEEKEKKLKRLVEQSSILLEKDDIDDNENAMVTLKGNMEEINVLKQEIQEMTSLLKEYLNSTTEYLNYSKSSTYIPSERNFFSLFSKTAFSLLLNEVPIPSSIRRFGTLLEDAQVKVKEFDIPFLNLKYSFDKDEIKLLDKKCKRAFNIWNMSSGIQTLVPLMMILENIKDQRYNQTFVIEEPEMNLFPETQYELIKHIVSKCNERSSNPLAGDTSNDIIITTHSPYCLSGVNNLVMASIVGKDISVPKEVEKIIPHSCWISKDDYSAYSLIDGTVRDIIDVNSGLIDNNELDASSIIINNDFNSLMEILEEQYDPGN